MDVVPDGGESELELMRRWDIKEPEGYADLPPIFSSADLELDDTEAWRRIHRR